MSAKEACGGSCLNSKPADPYAEGLQVVWHDPTSYDPNKHAPPYMPRMAAVRAGLAVNPKVARRLMGSGAPLSSLLALLRAAAFLHQTHHWQTRGSNFYGDHLLFERLYNDSQAFIDQVAERAVGTFGETSVDALVQIGRAHEFLSLVKRTEPTDLVKASLLMEQSVVVAISQVKAVLEAAAKLSQGTDNLLQGASDLHETFIYLLEQRAKPSAYSYGR